MPSIGRKNVGKVALPSSMKNPHDESVKNPKICSGAASSIEPQREIFLPRHAVFPELPPAQGELFFECTLFLYSVLAMFLQYLNLYKTTWWVPDSHVHYSLKLHLIDLYLLSCIGLILGRRVTLCFLKKITLVPPGFEPGNVPFFIQVIEWSIKLPAVGAILTSFSFSFMQVLSSYSWSSLIYVIYPILFYVLLFYNEIFLIFIDRNATTSSSKCSSNFIGRFFAYFRSPPYYVEPTAKHACSLSAYGIRAEVDLLIMDFYQRIKQSFFAAFTTAYYAIFLPCCFAPHYLYVDYWWSFEMFLIVFSTSWTVYVSYLFPLQYCDLLHRSAQHLGSWEKTERPSANLVQLPVSTWSEIQVFSEGSLVKQGRSVYRGQGAIIAAEPNNPDHVRFYAVLKDPMLLPNSMCLLQAGLIFCQFLMLVHSTEWQHIVTLVLLMFANYLMLFKLFKDKIIIGRIHNPNLDELGFKKVK